MRPRLAVATALLAALLAAVPAGAGEVRPVEAVGVVGLVPGQPVKTPPRDAAVQKALWEAVRRVALDLLGDSAEAPDTDTLLQDALGSDPLKYTNRFRILEDRGERPALFSEEPGVENEYVLLVEADVDVDRVRQSLTRSGLMAVPSGDTSRVQLRVTMELADGPAGFEAYDALRKALAQMRGVRSVIPVELERGRAVLAVEADRESRALLRDLLRSPPAGLRLAPLYAEADGLGLRVESTAPAAATTSDPIDTTTRKRY